MYTTKIHPLIGPNKGINKGYKHWFIIFSIKCRALYNRLLAFRRGPGGFRELREAHRKLFHLSWYLSDSVVTSYSQKQSWGELFSPSMVFHDMLTIMDIYRPQNLNIHVRMYIYIYIYTYIHTTSFWRRICFFVKGVTFACRPSFVGKASSTESMFRENKRETQENQDKPKKAIRTLGLWVSGPSQKIQGEIGFRTRKIRKNRETEIGTKIGNTKK